MRVLKAERQTEQEFLEEWEKNHRKPDDEEKLEEWERARQQAIGHWRFEQELEENDREQKAEKENLRERMRRYVNNHILGKQFDIPVVQETYCLPDIEPYTSETYARRPIVTGMECMTALAAFANLGMLDKLANLMGDAIAKGKSDAEMDSLWKGMLDKNREDYIRMRQECQCGKPERVIDHMYSAMQGMVDGALTSNWNYNRLIRYAGEQMERIFYPPEGADNSEMRCFRDKFMERDPGNVMRSFRAFKRMTELSALYQMSLEKLKDKTKVNEHFTPEELKDFLVGSVVSKELKNTYEQKKLTDTALRFGDIEERKNKLGGREIRYGDEKLYREMTESESYRKLSKMTIGEIRTMLHMEKQQETKKQEVKQRKPEAAMRKDDHVMVLKPKNYD